MTGVSQSFIIYVGSLERDSSLSKNRSFYVSVIVINSRCSSWLCHTQAKVLGVYQIFVVPLCLSISSENSVQELLSLAVWFTLPIYGLLL